jgi:hypothetical protein
MSVITVMKTADFVKTTMLPFCSCAMPWFRKARVSARSVAVLLLRSCRNIAVRTNARAYRLVFASCEWTCSCLSAIAHPFATKSVPKSSSPSATSSKLVRIGRSGRKRLSKNLTLPRVSWLTRSGLLIIVEVVVSALISLAPRTSFHRTVKTYNRKQPLLILGDVFPPT